MHLLRNEVNGILESSGKGVLDLVQPIIVLGHFGLHLKGITQC